MGFAGKGDANEELNNVKVTDLTSKEMMLLTSQIFDIRQEEMLESKTSGFESKRRSRTQNEVSKSVTLPPHNIIPKISINRVDKTSDKDSNSRNSKALMNSSF